MVLGAIGFFVAVAIGFCAFAGATALEPIMATVAVAKTIFAIFMEPLRLHHEQSRAMGCGSHAATKAVKYTAS